MEEYLVYVSPKGQNIDGIYEYEFLFSETPEIVYGPDWSYPNPSICTDVRPDPTTYSRIETVKSSLPFATIEEKSCYSMEYAMNRIIALSWVDIEGLEEYPQDEGRCVLFFGDDIEHVKVLLEKLGADFSF